MIRDTVPSEENIPPLVRMRGDADGVAIKLQILTSANNVPVILVSGGAVFFGFFLWFKVFNNLLEPWRSAALAVVIGGQALMLLLPLLYRFFHHRLRSQHVGHLRLGSNLLEWSSPDGNRKRRCSVHQVEDIWWKADLFGPIVFIRSDDGLEAMRVEETDQASWLVKVLSTWRQERSRPPDEQGEQDLKQMRALRAQPVRE